MNNDKLKVKQRGNINLKTRPKVKNKDGSYSTVRTIGIEDNGKHVNIPTVVNGRVVSNQEAVNHYRRTGQHLGKYSTREEADAAAKSLSKSQSKRYGK